MAVSGAGDDGLRRVHEGRWVVSRAWIGELTGASAATLARWYAQRLQQPEERRHPEVVCTVGRTHYFDQQAVEAFWAAWQEDVGTGLLGAAGRRRGDGRGANGGGPGREQRGKAVAVALQALRQAGGYHRGLAAQLAREHGGVSRTWQRAVNEARIQYDAEQGEGAASAPS
ncbi:hypothetical protein ACWET9_47150 [Streptomyces sp. NPDC004059]